MRKVPWLLFIMTIALVLQVGVIITTDSFRERRIYASHRTLRLVSDSRFCPGAPTSIFRSTASGSYCFDVRVGSLQGRFYNLLGAFDLLVGLLRSSPLRNPTAVNCSVSLRVPEATGIAQRGTAGRPTAADRSTARRAFRT